MSWHFDYPDVPRPENFRQATSTIPDLICCVYFFWNKGKCVYVGQSKNLRRRLQKHKKYLPGDVVTWIVCPRNELLRMEGFYIWLLHPRRNFRSNWQVEEEREALAKDTPPQIQARNELRFGRRFKKK